MGRRRIFNFNVVTLGGNMEVNEDVEKLTKALIMGVMEEDEEVIIEMTELAENIALSLTEQEVDTAKANAQAFLDHLNFKPTIH
jgi:hypothetical protein